MAAGALEAAHGDRSRRSAIDSRTTVRRIAPRAVVIVDLMDRQLRIVVSGASGLIGTALTTHLRSAGHTVVSLVRSGSKHRDSSDSSITWDPAARHLPTSAVDGADAVINLSGAGIGDHRWTETYKRTLLDSRLQTTELLAATIASCDHKPEVFLSGSAIGWYGPRGDDELTEVSTPGSGFLADLCRQWEEATGAAEAAGVRTAHLRTGIVLSRSGGALRKQLPLFKLGLGGKFGSGRQWQSWISIDDEVGAIEHLLTASVKGAVNLTAPNPVTNAEFTRTLGEVLHRPTVVPIPSFGPKLLLGSEPADALLFTGQRVLPAALTAAGYSFKHPTLEVALRDVLGK
jgi:uncharacterized protein